MQATDRRAVTETEAEALLLEQLKPSRRRKLYLAMKRVQDVTLSLLALVVLSPVLLLIALCAAGLAHVIPLKLPTVAYCSILGLLCACPLSPVSQFVIESAGKINFTAPLTMVGAFAGMSISNQLKMFFKQGWKLIIITVLVMTGTFFGSLVVAQVVLGLTHAI